VPMTQCSENFLECPEKYFISVVFICPYHNRPHLFFPQPRSSKKYFYFLPIFLLIAPKKNKYCPISALNDLICCPIYFVSSKLFNFLPKELLKIILFSARMSFFGGQHPTLLDGVHLF
jgi:hypothetical protein